MTAAEPQRILIVRMSALGDIVHALPVLAALRHAFPAAEIDWVADRKYVGVLDLVDGLNKRIVGRPHLMQAVTSLRARVYDVALELQGLLKSAAMARLSGAERVIGFEGRVLREPAASWFYTESVAVPTGAHIIQKNLSLLAPLGLQQSAVRFPFIVAESAVAERVTTEAATRGARGFALLNPGAAWSNKRWAPERFGALARHLRDRHGLASVVLWGSGELPLAQQVAAHSSSAATPAPETSLADLLALSKRAVLIVSGDTGPIHLAAAMGTPIVGLYGPTRPERNGPWHPDDVVVSRAERCECHHKRQCQREGAMKDQSRMCISEITVEEVAAAVDLRLSRPAEPA